MLTMTGTYEMLQLSATDGGMTYHLYAALPSAGTGYGTLSAVCDSELDKVLTRYGGTADFAFQRPPNMQSTCRPF